jgi:hypothetical protein
MAAFGGWRLTRTGILFVIGILVLGGLVTGGVFLVKNRGEAVRRDEAVKVAEQNLKDQSKTDASGNKDKADDTAPAAENGAQGQSGTAIATPDGATNNGTVAANNPAPSELPETGFGSLAGLGNILAVTILALSGAFYASSRTARTRS